MSDFLSGFRRSLTMLGLSTPPTPEFLEAGMPAPGFTLMDENRVPHHLSDYYGQWLVLYFYPKDNTPGCVMEACAFRDEIAPFHERNAKVVGISIDNADNHQKFIEQIQPAVHAAVGSGRKGRRTLRCAQRAAGHIVRQAPDFPDRPERHHPPHLEDGAHKRARPGRHCRFGWLPIGFGDGLPHLACDDPKRGRWDDGSCRRRSIV